MNYFEQGEIILVRYPFTINKKAQLKKRPALLISNKKYNLKNNSLVICCITSTIRNWPGSISIGDKDFLEGSLKKSSEIRVDQLFTIKKEEVIFKCGKIKPLILYESLENIKSILSTQ